MKNIIDIFKQEGGKQWNAYSLKQIFSVLCITILVFTCVSCTKTGTETEQVKDVPVMQLEYMANGETHQVNVLSGTSSWSFDNGDGTFTGEEVDSAHPLDSVGYMPEIEKMGDMSKIELIVSMPPDSYTVRCWQDKYIGDAEAYEQYYEMVDISDNVITLSDDSKGYVYEVHATWPQGDAYYSFYVK